MLIDTCLCGAKPPASSSFYYSNVTVRRCDCGVQFLESELTLEQHEAQFVQAYHSQERISRVVVNGAPAQFSDRYQHDYALAQRRLRRYCAFLSTHPRNIFAALDVGCANGAFVDYLRTWGVLAMGVEPDPSMARAHVCTGSLPAMVAREEVAGELYDLITYHDVLEHVLDPAAEVRAAASLLTPKGALVVDVPDVSTPDGHHHYKLEHLWYFTEGALLELFRRAGLTYIQVDHPIPGKLVMYGRRARCQR